MSYTSNKLLAILALTTATAVSLNAATLAKFTFNNSGADIDETAGWQPAGGASLDPDVFITTNTSVFGGTTGLTIAPLVNVPFSFGMQPTAAADTYAGTVNPLGSNPTTSVLAVQQIAAIGQFTVVNNYGASLQITTESLVIQGVGTNLKGILLQDNDGDVSFQAAAAPNGQFNMTFDLTGRGDIIFAPESYTLYLVAANGAGPKVGVSFSDANGDFIDFNGVVEIIPEPSVYMAGAGAIMMGAFLCYRRKKAKQNA